METEVDKKEDEGTHAVEAAIWFASAERFTTPSSCTNEA